VKKIVSLSRLSEAMAMFQEAKGMPLGKRAMQVGRACSVFTSVRGRLGVWRDRQVAGLQEYNHQKECSLRIERDRWLYSQFTKFASSPSRVYGYVEQDAKKTEVLEKVKGLIEGGADRGEIMRCIWANDNIFKASRKKHPENAKPDYLSGHYGWLHRYVKRGEMKKALAKADYLMLFTEANKPRFILDELSKDADPYLSRTLSALGRAVRAFEAQQFKTAQKYFVQAVQEMRAIVYR
jgi:hypothetical protein